MRLIVGTIKMDGIEMLHLTSCYMSEIIFK